MAVLVVAGAACSSDSDPSAGAGGATASGGSAGTGGGSLGGSGATATTGGAASGGVPASGGATGGATVTGGALGTGGATLTGGTSATGGTALTGGTSATGGTALTGGTSATGGTALTGGTSATGGTAVTGGTAGAGVGGGPGTGGSDGGQGGALTTGGAGGAASGGGPGETGGAGGTGPDFMPCPTTPGTACSIMPVGDSITEGCCTPPMGGYRIELYRQALTNQKNITFVGTQTNGPETVDGQPFPKKHEGHGGWKISQIAGIIDQAISSSNPHIVLLKIGTNDINGNDDIANAPNRLASLIDQITNDVPSALLVVSAIIPTTNDGTNTRVQAYNAAIKDKAEAAAAAGKHVVFVDNYAAFAENPNYKTALMADGLHPNAEGYAVLGQSFYDLISALLPAAQ